MNALRLRLQTLLVFALLFLDALTTQAITPQKPTSAEQVPQGLEKSDWANIRAAHKAWEHSFMPLEGGGFQARNKAQQWTTQFDGRGFLTKPKARVAVGPRVTQLRVWQSTAGGQGSAYCEGRGATPQLPVGCGHAGVVRQ